MKLSFKHLLTITTTFIAGCAAFFSVWGIGKLFAGAEISTMVMATSLEAGKIVAVTFLYRYWQNIKFFLRTYLLSGALILMLITSAGIYGYLSSAYASAAIGFQAQRGEVALVETRQNSLTTTYNSNSERVKSNDNRIQQLQLYRAQQENRLDSLMGRNGFAAQQTVVRQADAEIRRLQTENRTIEQQNISLLAQRDSLEQEKLLKETATNTNSKLGTFWYIAEAIGVPLDTVVKWFILMIVLVFDPLSIALVIAYNVIKRKEEEEPEGEPPAPTPSSPPPSQMLWPETVDAAWRDAGIETTSPPDDKTLLETVFDTPPEPQVKQTEIVDPEISPVHSPPNYLPYYLRSEFDWNDKESWIHDPEAVKFNEQRMKSR